ncbi:MAG: WbqC family protein [Hyphomicrobiaceae bacterium]
MPDHRPRLCAIHQPNFFPWLGYFDKIRRADVFVLLDAVDYPRSGSDGMGSIVNRVRIAVQGREHAIGPPLRRAALGTPISAIQIDDHQPWRDKLLRTLAMSYARAANYAPAMALLEPLIRHPEPYLAAFNIHAITAIARHLGLATPLLRQSEFGVPGAATELLINLTRAAGCDGYLAGGGAGGYQQDGMFAAAGLLLVYQGFEPRLYGPTERFLPGLSVIDYLMHDGRELGQLEKGGPPC